MMSLSGYCAIIFLFVLLVFSHAKITTHGENENVLQNASLEGTTHLTSAIDSKILFEPSFLAFNASPLCITSIASIQLVNTNHKDNITILSVSTDSLHFHPSILVQQSIAEPGGKRNATINIIFLPRTVGKIPDVVLVVQTNIGAFIYHMSGEGVQNVYRLSPVLNHKLPVDVDYRKPIHIYNPHSETLLIKEIYTSELFLLLGLPEANAEEGASNDASSSTSKATSAAIRRNPNVAGTLWTIPPYSSKTVIFLNFKAKQPGTYQGFVHLKTNFDPLIVHVEFIVSKNGVHRVVDELDFGTIISPSEHRKREVMLLNSSPQPVMVSDVYSSSPDAHIQIDFVKGRILPPETVTSAATVVYSGKEEGEFTGTILFMTNDSVQVGSRIEVPYKARVLYGTLDYLADSTAFHVGSSKQQEEQTSELTFMNKFSVPVQFKSAIVEDDATYSIHGFESGRILHPSEKMRMLKVHVHPNDTNLLQKSNLIIETNITRVSVPLYCFHGDLAFETAEEGIEEKPARIIPMNVVPAGTEMSSDEPPVEKPSKPSTSENARINFGVLESDTEKHFEFYLTNHNPVPVDINGWKVLLDEDSGGCTGKGNDIRVSFVRLIPGDTDTIDSVFYDATASRKGGAEEADINTSHDSSISLQSGDRVMMRVDVRTTEVCEQHGQIIFDTTYRKVRVALDLIVMEGSLSFPEMEFHFADAFPGRVQRLPVYAENSYSRNVSITEIVSEDNRFDFVAQSMEIQSSVAEDDSTAGTHQRPKQHQIGYIEFNPSVMGKKGNYMKDKRHNRKQQQHEFAAVVTPDEINNYIQRRGVFYSMQRKGETKVSSHISLKTDVLKTYKLEVSADLIMPPLTSVKQGTYFDLGRIQVGKGKLSRMITVRNPSDYPLHVKLLIGNDALKSSILTEYRQDSNQFAKYSQFSIDTTAEGAAPTAIIEPNSERELGPIVFSANAIGDAHAVLYIRNNLTIFDFVEIHAVGGNGRLMFLEKGKALEQLHFHIESAQLMSMPETSVESILDTEESELQPQYQKVFTLTNNGNDDLLVYKSSLNDQNTCATQGVTLHTCGKFKLKPGDKRMYKISFTPDLKSQVQHMEIHFDTNQGLITFPIRFETPSSMLPLFAQLSVENTSKVLSMRGLMMLLIVCIGFGVIVYIFRELRGDAKTRSSRKRSKTVEIEDVEAANISNLRSRDSSSESEEETLPEPVSTKRSAAVSGTSSKKASKKSKAEKKAPIMAEEKITDTVLDIKEEVGLEISPSVESVAPSQQQHKSPETPASAPKVVSPTPARTNIAASKDKAPAKMVIVEEPIKEEAQQQKKIAEQSKKVEISTPAVKAHTTARDAPAKDVAPASTKSTSQKPVKEVAPAVKAAKKNTPPGSIADSSSEKSTSSQTMPATKSRSSSLSSHDSGFPQDRKRSTSTSSTDHKGKVTAVTTTSRDSTSVEKQRFRSTGFSDPERRVYRSKSYENRRAQMQARETRNARVVVQKSTPSSSVSSTPQSRSVSSSPNESPQPIVPQTIPMGPLNSSPPQTVLPEKLSVRPPKPTDLLHNISTAPQPSMALESNYESLFTPTSMLQGGTTVASSMGPTHSIPSWDSYSASAPRPVDHSPVFSLFHSSSGGSSSSNSSPNPTDVFNQNKDSSNNFGGIFGGSLSLSGIGNTRREGGASNHRSLFEQSDPYDFFASEQKSPNKPVELFFKPSSGGSIGRKNQ